MHYISKIVCILTIIISICCCSNICAKETQRHRYAHSYNIDVICIDNLVFHAITYRFEHKFDYIQLMDVNGKPKQCNKDFENKTYIIYIKDGPVNSIEF